MHSALFKLERAAVTDLELLITLRIKAMQPSLEALGRFDKQRARDRFASGFTAQLTHKIMLDEQLAGFYVLLDREDHLYLDHFYIDPDFQGVGLGAKVMVQLQQSALTAKLPLRLAALKESRANHFYLDHGFVKIATQEWDNIYQWSAQ